MSNKPVTTKLYIGNLPDLCRKEELQAKFEKYGNIVEFDIVSNYGFCHFQKPDEAKAAADALNGTNYNGNEIKVELSHSRVRQKPGMGDREGCFRCGQEGHWSKDCPKGPRRPRPPPGGPGGPGGPRVPFDDPYLRDPYRDPYADPYYRARYLPPPPSYGRYDPYDPYDRRPLPPLPRDPYLRDRLADPYARDLYARRSPTHPAGLAGVGRDPYGKDPYPPRAADPYAARSADPYAARSADPYATRAADLYAARAADPYAAREDPYAARAADPYANRPANRPADPYANRPANRPADPYANRPADPAVRPPATDFSRDPYPAAAATGGAARDPYDEFYDKRRAYTAAVRPAPYTKPAMNTNQGMGNSNQGSGQMAQSGRVPGPY